jgi:hypothetical protein
MNAPISQAKWALGTAEMELLRGDVSSYVDEMSAKLSRRMIELATSAVGKRVSELTEEQKFSVAYVAGIRMENKGWEGKDAAGKWVMQTEPCAIVARADGGFDVYAMQREQGSET